MHAYVDEAELQALIVESPELVIADEDHAAVVLRELALPAAGSVDVLIVHLNGELTLVEAKLNRNAEIRRAVVGQLLACFAFVSMSWKPDHSAVDQ